jgi:hypothetical protein
MKILTVLLVLALSTLSSTAQVASAESIISDLEYKWAEAQKLGEADVVEPMLAHTFVNTDTDGETYGKARLLSNLKGGKWEVNGISNVKVSVYGNAAVATGSWRGKGIDGDGTRIDRSEHWTDTWVKNANANGNASPANRQHRNSNPANLFRDCFQGRDSRNVFMGNN